MVQKACNPLCALGGARVGVCAIELPLALVEMLGDGRRGPLVPVGVCVIELPLALVGMLGDGRRGPLVPSQPYCTPTTRTQSLYHHAHLLLLPILDATGIQDGQQQVASSP